MPVLRSTIEEAPEEYNDIKEELVQSKEGHEFGANCVPGEEIWDQMVSRLTACYLPNESNHILCQDRCLAETPRFRYACCAWENS